MAQRDSDMTPLIALRRFPLFRTPAGVTLVVGVLLILGLALLEMSGSGERTAVTDGTASQAFTAIVKPGQSLCQPNVVIPKDGGGAQYFIGTYDLLMPALHVVETDKAGNVLAIGSRPAGGPQGNVTVPFTHSRPGSGTMCLTIGGHHQMAIGGSQAAVNDLSQTLDGKPQGAQVAITIMRPGKENWWQLLPTVFRRFGYGKWEVMGSWTLILCFVAFVAIAFVALRVMWTESS